MNRVALSLVKCQQAFHWWAHSLGNSFRWNKGRISLLRCLAWKCLVHSFPPLRTMHCNTLPKAWHIHSLFQLSETNYMYASVCVYVYCNNYYVLFIRFSFQGFLTIKYSGVVLHSLLLGVLSAIQPAQNYRGWPFSQKAQWEIKLFLYLHINPFKSCQLSNIHL